MKQYHIYWGESHDNTYQFPSATENIEEVLRRASTHLDFYAAAYYTAYASAFQEGGHQSDQAGSQEIILEGWKEQEQLDREWQEIQAATAKLNAPGEFVTFPGYEWQGDGSGGDHNVFALKEGLPIFKVNTLAELYDALRAYDALAIPHHTAYRAGRRGRDWSVYDPRLSPFAEVYSVHGCSETDEEWIGLRNNFYMGPGFGGGTYQDALDRGHHVGAVCSTDNWGDMPGCYGNGAMAVLATGLTRRELWDAFKNRRVYGVTGDRIKLDFKINGHGMGSVITTGGKREIEVGVEGADAIDRIELLRNGKVIHTHCHQGTWELPRAGRESRFKIKIEAGWGPRKEELDLPDRRWRGGIEIGNGRMVDFSPCWISGGQGPVDVKNKRTDFSMRSSGATVKSRHQNGTVFEFSADVTDTLTVSLNGLSIQKTVEDFCRKSRELWYKDECVKMLSERADIPMGSPERDDVYHMYAYKAKIHRAIPESGCTARLSFEDDTSLEGEANYRVRVEQRNGQRAWSSPIWVSEK